MLDRRAAVARILAARGDALVVTGLGSTTWDAAAAGDHPNNFYLWGGMGGAAMVGLGLANAQAPRRVLVITGDGEMLMGMSGLATIGAAAPANLAIAVIDNERYGETGMQETHTAHGVDLAAVAAGAGFAAAGTLRTMADVEAWIPRIYSERGPLLAAVKVGADAAPMILPPRDGAWIRARFRDAVLGAKAQE